MRRARLRTLQQRSGCPWYHTCLMQQIDDRGDHFRRGIPRRLHVIAQRQYNEYKILGASRITD